MRQEGGGVDFLLKNARRGGVSGEGEGGGSGRVSAGSFGGEGPSLGKTSILVRTSMTQRRGRP